VGIALFGARSIVRYVLACFGVLDRIFSEHAEGCAFSCGTYLRLFVIVPFLSVLDPWQASFMADSIIITEINRKPDRPRIQSSPQSVPQISEPPEDEHLLPSSKESFCSFYQRAIVHGQPRSKFHGIMNDNLAKRILMRKVIKMRRDVWIATKEVVVLTIMLICDKLPFLGLMMYFSIVATASNSTDSAFYVAVLVSTLNFCLQVWEWLHVLRIRMTLSEKAYKTWCKVMGLEYRPPCTRVCLAYFAICIGCYNMRKHAWIGD